MSQSSSLPPAAASFADEARGPWARPSGVALDAAVTVAAVVTVLVGSFLTGRLGFLGVGLLGVLQVLPLLVRRVRPAWCLVLVTLLSAAQLPLIDTPGWGQIAVPLTVYAAVTYGGTQLGRVALGLGLVGAVVGPADWLLRSDLPAFAVGVALCAFVVFTSWLLGTLGRTRRAYVEQLIERGIRLEREAAQRAELAASEERARIAREMHDIVAHGLSVMVVQADGARYQLDRDPDRVGRALDTIAGTGREALSEMRRLLGLLRADDEPTARTAPQPGLATLPQLLDDDLGRGVSVEAHVAPDLPEVGAGVGLTAYRIVQEALTNVRKHAGPDAHVVVDVGTDGQALRITVSDDGRGASAPDDGSGHGLVGMRERAGVVGGSLRAGPRPGGGFEVDATLPYAVERSRR